MKLFYKEYGPVATNSYIVIDDSTNDAVVIDVPPDSKDDIKKILENEKANLKEIWLTHSHWDHTGDAPDLRDEKDVPILLHKSDEYRLLDPNSYLGFSIPYKFRAAKADSYIKENDELFIGSIKFRVIETPGHTEGGVSFYCEEENILIVGDTLFKDSIGRTDLHGGDIHTLLNSIKEKVITLPDSTDVYPGHGPKTTILREKKLNPFIRQYILKDDNY